MGAFHARTIAASQFVDVIAVLDSDAAAAATVAGEIGAEPCSTTGQLLDIEEVDAWLIATPTTSHPPLVREALAAGLHVLCEKPLSLDAADSARLGAEAAAKDLILQVGFWRRFSPPWATAKRLIDAGAIGRPLLVRLSQWDADPPPASFCDPAKSGGLAIDCGVHEFDLAEWLTGLHVEKVTSFNLPLVDESLAEVGDVDNLVAVLELTGGVVATVDLSRNCRYGDDVRTEILGEQGAIFVDLLPAGRTRLATAEGVEVVAGSETEDAFGVGIRAQAEAFASAVAGQSVDIPLADASTRAVATGTAIQQAAVGESVGL
jgi:predicted dehydrogenase